MQIFVLFCPLFSGNEISEILLSLRETERQNHAFKCYRLAFLLGMEGKNRNISGVGESFDGIPEGYSFLKWIFSTGRGGEDGIFLENPNPQLLYNVEIKSFIF